MKKSTLILLTTCWVVTVAPLARAQEHKLIYADDGTFGYRDTPMQPWSAYRVHDPDRPKPKMIDPGTFSTQDRPGRPPSDAIVLLGGKDLSKWKPNQWKVENGDLIATTGRFETIDDFGSYQLHLEWQAPNPPVGDDIMNRGNNGVLLMGSFEIQIFDPTTKIYPDGQAAAVYGQTPPLVTASLPRASGKCTTSFSSRRSSTETSWKNQLVSPSCTTACSSRTTKKSMALPHTPLCRGPIGPGEPVQRWHSVRITTRCASGTFGSGRCECCSVAWRRQLRRVAAEGDRVDSVWQPAMCQTVAV